MGTQATKQPIKAPGIVATLLMGLIRAYQLTVSRLMVSRCRFSPSCSAYAHDALAIHGPLRGSWLAVARLARCHPWNEGGWDPVPDRFRAQRSIDA